VLPVVSDLSTIIKYESTKIVVAHKTLSSVKVGEAKTIGGREAATNQHYILMYQVI
jgi:hypothetical protein